MAGCDDLHLPPEIQREILIRVSVKTILRCRSVCKSWYSLISCPNFISDYSPQNPNKNRNRVLLVLESYQPYVRPYCSLDESSMEFYKHDVIHDRSYLSILGSCNGLICLTGSHTFLVWNPTIRKIVELPPSPRTLCHGAQMLPYCGFGFASKTNDYKILRVVHKYKTDYSSYYDAMCEIFDLSKGVWRVICPQVPQMPSSPRHRYIPECYLDGSVHWSDRGVVLSFSFNDECFREMKMPDYEKQSPNHGIGNIIFTKCVTFNGMIHLIVCSGLDCCSIWTMKEYGVAKSWAKALNVDMKRVGDLFPNVMLLWKNGEVLMARQHWENIGDICQKKNDELVSYVPESDEFESIFFFVSDNVSSMCLYEESLVLV